MSNKDCNPLPVTSGADSHITSDENIERILLSPSKREDIRALLAQGRRLANIDAQLVWLAVWCKDKTGVDSNDVIGTEGWPSKLVEVIAQAVNAHTVAHISEIRRYWTRRPDDERIGRLLDVEGKGLAPGQILKLDRHDQLRALLTAARLVQPLDPTNELADALRPFDEVVM